MNLPQIITVVLAAAFIVILPLYIRQENRLNFVSATAMKLTLSGLFTIISLLSALTMQFELSNILIFAGMCFAIAGDYFLQFIRIDIKKFKCGVVFFGLCQICFIAAFFVKAGFHWAELAILAALLLTALILMTKQKWELGAARGVLTAYTVLIAYMCAKAVTLAINGALAPVGAVVVGVGGLLFFISDMILGIWNYKTDDMLHADMNWVTYFAGQLLIAIGAGLW